MMGPVLLELLRFQKKLEIQVFTQEVQPLGLLCLPNRRQGPARHCALLGKDVTKGWWARRRGVGWTAGDTADRPRPAAEPL